MVNYIYIPAECVPFGHIYSYVSAPPSPALRNDDLTEVGLNEGTFSSLHKDAV